MHKLHVFMKITTKRNLRKRMACFIYFVQFNVWPNRKQLDSHIVSDFSLLQ